MQLNPAVFDVWVFRRTPSGVAYLVLHTSQAKADKHFNGGRFWQVPSGFFRDGELVTDAINRELSSFGVRADAVWAAEHRYTIYNRRFHEMQLISVFAAESSDIEVVLHPDEHTAFEWLPFEAALE